MSSFNGNDYHIDAIIPILCFLVYVLCRLNRALSSGRFADDVGVKTSFYTFFPESMHATDVTDEVRIRRSYDAIPNTHIYMCVEQADD